MGEPLFIPSVFSKVLAVVLLIAIAGLAAVGIIQGEISTLDIGGTLVSAVIIAYIVHLWIFYWKRTD
jgi:hypothetical protein